MSLRTASNNILFDDQVSIDLQIIGLSWSFVCLVDIFEVVDVAPATFANELVLISTCNSLWAFHRYILCEVKTHLLFIKSCGDCGFRTSAVIFWSNIFRRKLVEICRYCCCYAEWKKVGKFNTRTIFKHDFIYFGLYEFYFIVSESEYL